jgi:hypothetical protein
MGLKGGAEAFRPELLIQLMPRQEGRGPRNGSEAVTSRSVLPLCQDGGGRKCSTGAFDENTKNVFFSQELARLMLVFSGLNCSTAQWRRENASH